MRVLVSCKTTNLDVHGESIKKKIANGILSNDHLARLQEDHKKHHQCLKKLLKILDSQDISYVEVGRGLYWPELDGFDAIISVGGDGTVLEASHHITDQDIPILGVRSSSMSVGYLCTCDINMLEDYVTTLKNAQYKTETLCRIKAKIVTVETGRETETDPILNDFLFSNSNPAATTRYNLQIGDQIENHKSSGIWFATAAGSTAAIRTVGGVEYERTSPIFQYMVREAYTPPKSENFKLLGGEFDPDSTMIKIENLCNHAILAFDGQHGQAQLTFGDTITLKRAKGLRLIV